MSSGLFTITTRQQQPKRPEADERVNHAAEHYSTAERDGALTHATARGDLEDGHGKGARRGRPRATRSHDPIPMESRMRKSVGAESTRSLRPEVGREVGTAGAAGTGFPFEVTNVLKWTLVTAAQLRVER